MEKIIYFFKIKSSVSKVFKKYQYMTKQEMLSEELNNDLAFELHSVLNMLLFESKENLHKYIIIKFFDTIRSYFK